MTVRSKDTFNARRTLSVGGRQYTIYSLERLESVGLPVQRLPYSLKVLLENLLRHEDGKTVDADDVKALAGWQPKAVEEREISFLQIKVTVFDFAVFNDVVEHIEQRRA